MAKKKKKKKATALKTMRVGIDNAIPLPEAAALADVTDTWMRRLVTQGVVVGLKIGRSYIVDRESALAYKRTPNMGRPRSES
jgi:hypothetical protein